MKSLNVARTFASYQALYNRATISNIFHATVAPAKLSETKKTDSHSRSHKLLVNNGFIRYSGNTGQYIFLPLGLKVLNKLIKIIDDEMAAIGGQKIVMPTMTSAELWKKSGRWESAQSELFTLTDRHDKEYCLGPTFEEAVTEVIASLSQPPSKSFPLKLYQITRKYRDELRSHLGLLRSKEFYMKDMYSFDVGLGEAKHAYEQVCLAYESIVNRLQLSDHYAKVVGDTGIIGGSLSHEYHLLADVGQDVVLLCPKCKIGRNIVINDSPTQICDVCSSNLDTKRGIEVAHTFLLETKYSKIFDASYLSKEKQTELLQMGCYGIGISRLLAASVEVLSTDELIRWPHPIVPYEICIVPPKMGSKEAASSLMADHLYDVLSSIFPNDVIIDDRTNLSIGRRVLDAKRLGFPFVIVCGKHTLETLPKIELNDVYGSSRCLLTHSELIAKFKYLRNVTNR